MSRLQGVFWLLSGVLAHFLVNSPFNEGITSKSGNITILILSFNLCLALAALKAVDGIVDRDASSAAEPLAVAER